MPDRSLLGPADVDDAELSRMAAALLGHRPDDVTLLSSEAEHVAYDIPAITTAGRYWVTGTARTPDGDESFRIFVKHVQAWQRSPLFQLVPPEFRAAAAAGVPWRTEPLAYRSDLGDRLPEGLRMPRALGVFDLDEESAAVWLEEVAHPAQPWDTDRFARAARLLGRLAASPSTAPLSNVGDYPWTIHRYVEGRVALQVLPMLRDPEIWTHPLIADAFDGELRSRLLTAADRIPAYATELADFPVVTSHGDASPNNLLPGPTPDSFVLIDYGFWVPNPLGFDLGQLLVGDVQLGRRSPELLAETDAAIVPAYRRGLADEGLHVDEADVRRAHALQLLIFSGLSALPFEHLDAEPTPELRATSRTRAALATFSLDLVDATG